MNTPIKMYIAAAIAAIFAIALLGFSWSNHQIAKLESEVATAKTIALEKERSAVAKEIEAAEYKQKIEYLETKLTQLGQLARKQDEDLQNLNNTSRNARNDVEHALRTRTVTTTHTELCQKLAELGHPCE